MTSMKTVLLSAAFVLAANAAEAASFKNLVADGYAVGPMSRGKSGSWGWVLSKGGAKSFCTSRVTAAIKNNTTYVLYTSAGRSFEINRGGAYERALGSTKLPLLSDLKAGRPRAEDVGACSKLK
ncbi:MAG: hypothetical protein WAT78_06670 [Rhizobiaceae bacterium]